MMVRQRSSSLLGSLPLVTVPYQSLCSCEQQLLTTAPPAPVLIGPSQSSQVLRSSRHTSTRRAAKEPAPGSPLVLLLRLGAPACTRLYDYVGVLRPLALTLSGAPPASRSSMCRADTAMSNATSKSALSLVTRLGSALNSTTTSQHRLNIREQLGPIN